MNMAKIICDDVKIPLSPEKNVINLSTIGTNPNIRFQVEVFRTHCFCEIPKRLEDLLRLAAFIYGADTRVSRGSEKDVFAEKWVRTFQFILPVWDLEFWKTTSVQQSLIETLQFLTGDEYNFDFVQRSQEEPRQSIFQFKDSGSSDSLEDTVILFSGGADSLAAVLEAIRSGLHPILVSHRSAPSMDNRQKMLVELLQEKFNGWSFPHISMWVNRSHDKRNTEFSQRSRAFLFSSLGAVTASVLNINEIRLCDNGIVSVNLPQSGQNIGTFLSRSTHPRFLSNVQQFMRLVTDCNSLCIKNTLIYKTKKEVLEIIADSGHPELLQETGSCSHIEGYSKLQPHCGVCTQCIDRRFASESAKLAEHDIPNRYEKDIFSSPLEEGDERTHAENYVRFAYQLEEIKTSNEFWEKFPELYDCLPIDVDTDVAQCANALWELFQKHQKIVNGVLEKKLQEYLRAIRRASLPKNCLLQMVVDGQHKIDSRVRYIKRLCFLITRSLPPAFQTRKAENEHHVQDIGESIFIASQLEIQRESPQIPFGVITTKPDFANIEKGSMPLFVEFKYINGRKRLNGIVTEMSSRVLVYRDQGAWVLFIVYDPDRAIIDDEKFVAEFSKHEGIWVGVVR
ncbi:MAG: Uncharacterized protein LiPW30_704 [Parcubacteria group bacterium LiPW_30]|nr:MAG: Uncharacterized protein LiPW30_704 [Parcubacteria group bacterium LiPW_30]